MMTSLSMNLNVVFVSQKCTFLEFQNLFRWLKFNPRSVWLYTEPCRAVWGGGGAERFALPPPHRYLPNYWTDSRSENPWHTRGMNFPNILQNVIWMSLLTSQFGSKGRFLFSAVLSRCRLEVFWDSNLLSPFNLHLLVKTSRFYFQGSTLDDDSRAPLFLTET